MVRARKLTSMLVATVLVLSLGLIGILSISRPVYAGGAPNEYHVTTAVGFHDALNQAETSDIDDIIYLAAGTYVSNFEYTPQDTWSLIIRGELGTTAQDVILDGGDTGSVLKLYGSTTGITYGIEGITLRNGSYSGLYCWCSPGQSMDLTVNSVIIENNYTSSMGGGISINTDLGTSYNVEIYDSIIRDNEAGKRGGGLHAHTYNGSSIQLIMANCLIYGNQADWSSGGIQLSASEVGNNNTTNATLINCTISDNWLNDVGPGAGIYVLAHEGNGAEVVADIYNTIVYDNTLPGDIAEDLTINMDAPGTVTVNTKFCNIGNIDDLILDDGWGPPIFNTTNVSGEDPDFVDPASGDYHLIATSPCIDDGTALVPDPPGLPLTDLDGNLRVIGTRPDIGAYEYTGVPATEPTIEYSPNSLSFIATEGGSNPPAQNLDIWNSGGGTLDWSLLVPVWLSPSLWSGSSTGEIDTVTASVDISGMVAGDYDETILIVNSAAPIQTVPVYLTINPPMQAVETWNCPLGGVTLIAPYPIRGRPYLTVPVDPAEITASAGAALWGIYSLDETTGEWLYFIPGFTSSTLTQLEPDEFYLVAVSDACDLLLFD
ncbi:choice-of-anchor Q domain-containing protein [Chloroflexota bacterium]